MAEEPANTPEGRHFVWVLQCPCGARLAGDSEDDIVNVASAHLADVHPELAENYEREHILFMSTKFLR